MGLDYISAYAPPRIEQYGGLICGWRVGLTVIIVRMLADSSLTRGNNYVILYQPNWASWITDGEVS